MNFYKSSRALLIFIRKVLLADFSGLMRLYYRYFWKATKGSIYEFLNDYSVKNPNLFFIQVGSNDGFQNDLLYKFILRDQWKGILIEPQPKPFKILSYIYRKKNVKLLNVAIDNKSKSRKLYKIAVSNSRWARGLSSFDEAKIKGLIYSKRVIRKSKNEGVKMPLNPETFVAFDEVKCVSFDDLIAKNTIKKIDLLQIDTEGYDFELLKQFPFETLKPNVIIFENIHLSTEDCKNAESLLEKQAYQLKDFGSDTLAKLIG